MNKNTAGTPKFLGRDKETGQLIFNPYHPDYLICVRCGKKEIGDTTDDHFCSVCFVCDACPHIERKHKRKQL